MKSAEKSPIDAVVLGCWENGYGVARQLAEEKLKVAGVFTKKGEVWRHSRYFSEALEAPNPGKEPEAFLDFLLRHADRWRGALLIPTNDHYLEALSREKDRLTLHYKVLAADYSVAANALDKSRLYKIAESIGIATPVTRYYDHPAALAAEASQLEFPCLLKPSEGHRFFETYGRKLFIAKNAGELLEHFTGAFNRGLRVGVQENIPGPETNLVGYYNYTAGDGTVLFEITKKKLRQNPPHFGVGRVSKMEKRPEVIELGRRLFQALNYRGLGALEFKQNARDGRWIILDMNARFPLGHLLCRGAGVNLAYLIYQDCVQGIRVPAAPRREGIYWINLNEDIRNTFLRYSSQPITLKSWIEPYCHEHVFADFDPRDPVPFILRMGWVAQWFAKRVLRGVTRLFLSRPPAQERIEKTVLCETPVKETSLPE